jgi:hypothetical protein
LTHLLHILILVQLTDSDDTFKWNLTSGIFTVKSMYIDLLNDDTVYLKRNIWKMKVPLKIRIFMWFLHKKVILTKDNLAKRNWQGMYGVVFVIKKRQYNTFLCPVISLA